jgi:hypothetical protein
MLACVTGRTSVDEFKALVEVLSHIAQLDYSSPIFLSKSRGIVTESGDELVKRGK